MKTILTVPFYFLLLMVSTVANSKSIHEEKFISIGGIEQWVTIHGTDLSKPVILFLHGGPGSVMTPYNSAIYEPWEKDFILVNWDQRGAGRTFGRNAPAEVDEKYWIEHPLTIQQMTSDGIDLSEYLQKHLGKQKVILIGTSWGSILGVSMAQKRPELFYAYIGHSQVVDASENLTAAYHKIFKIAQSANDQTSVDKLTSVGPPPYDDARNAGQLLRIIKKYERENSTPAPDSWWKLAPAYDNELDAKHREEGDDYSFINYVGHKKLGMKAMNATVHFMKEGLVFKIPVYLIQGEADILTPKEITKSYFDQLKAPAKEFFLLPGATHGYTQSVVDTQYKILTTYVSPLLKK